MICPSQPWDRCCLPVTCLSIASAPPCFLRPIPFHFTSSCHFLCPPLYFVLWPPPSYPWSGLTPFGSTPGVNGPSLTPGFNLPLFRITWGPFKIFRCPGLTLQVQFCQYGVGPGTQMWALISVGTWVVLALLFVTPDMNAGGVEWGSGIRASAGGEWREKPGSPRAEWR